MNPNLNSWDMAEEEDTMKGLYISFSLHGKEYAFEIKYLLEIMALPAITTIPGSAKFLKGVVNLRGKIVPVMDLHLRFSMESVPYHDRTCILLVDINTLTLGLIVDKVNEVVQIPDQNIDLAPKIGESHASRFVYATGRVGESIKILIDLERLLTDDEAQIFMDIPKS
jgi:purine-binding chemotaxis protein CheW